MRRFEDALASNVLVLSSSPWVDGGDNHMVRQGEADHAKHRTLSVPIQPKLPWIVSRVNLDLNEQRVNVWGKYLEEAK